MKIFLFIKYLCKFQICYILLQIVCIIVSFKLKVEHPSFFGLLGFFFFKYSMGPL
jgi:hypothetical protein